MNPLDPDMDRDGIDDGQEVAQGSDPFFPEQTDISPELEEDVSDFLTQAIELEIEAYRQGSADVAASVMAGSTRIARDRTWRRMSTNAGRSNTSRSTSR